MNLEKEMIYVGCSRYDFTPDGEKESISASKAFLIDFTQLKKDKDKVGMVVSELRGDYSLFEKLRNLEPLKPYKFSLAITVDGKKSTVVLLDVATSKNG